jgi:hypothetical protein
MDRSLRETGNFEPQSQGCKQHYSSKWTEDEIQNHTEEHTAGGTTACVGL